MDASPVGPGDGGRPPAAWIGVGFELAVAVVLFMFAGFKADAWLGTRPWLTLAGAVLGMCIGFYGFFRRLTPPGGGTKGGS